jgi:allophanate hydrolase subunit 2
MNNITIIIRILFAVTLFQHPKASECKIGVTGGDLSCHLNRKPLSIYEYIKVTPGETSPVT